MLLILTGILAFYVAWNLGGNDVANAMGTSVGAKALTLRQALVVAGVLEFVGAALFGDRVSTTLATVIIDPSLFTQNPQLWVLGMVAALIACGLWLQIATLLGLPVSSSHAVVGAIAGFGWIAVGASEVNWPAIRTISLMWVVTPVMSGAIAAFLYRTLKCYILDTPNPLQSLDEWIPWLSLALVTIFGWIAFPTLLRPLPLEDLPLPVHDVYLGLGAIAAASLTFYLWRTLRHERAGLTETLSAEYKIPGKTCPYPPSHGSATVDPTDVTAEALRSSDSAILQDSAILPIVSHPSTLPILEPAATPIHGSAHRGSADLTVEASLQRPSTHPPIHPSTHQRSQALFARFQILSACFVAFAHGSNDVGNAVAPLAAIAFVQQYHTVPGTTDAAFTIPLWVLLLGGAGLVGGLAVLGKNVIRTIGEGIIPLQPSLGFSAELATAVTVLLATRLGLPVSTSHALVGAVVGVGLVRQAREATPVKVQTLRQIAMAWIVTIPLCGVLAAALFALGRWGLGI